MKIKILIIFLSILSKVVLSQSVSQQIDIEAHIDKILLEKGEEADNQSYYELLMQFFNSPIGINNCSSSELTVLQLLSNNQVIDILNYRNKHGAFNNKYELLAIESLSLEEIKDIIPFLSFNKPIKLKSILKNTVSSNNNYILASVSKTLERSDGFISDKFLGDPYQFNFRIKFVNPGHTSLGITVQKDPGELLFSNDSLYTGPDFYSFHYYIQNQARVKQLVLGDYKLQFGQGLLLGAGFLVGKNASSITSIQSTLKIQPYTSLTEFNFFRGIGTTISISDNWELSLFYSNKLKDATILIQDSLATNITSLRSNGLHRTASERIAQNSVQEQVIGSALTFANSSFEVGILGLYNKFSIPFEPQPTLGNLYKFRGQENYNASVFGKYYYQNITLYGEAAHTLKNGSAINVGIISSLSKNIDLSFQYRYLDPNFHSFYGVSFAESSALANERGAYWGINIKLSPSFTIMGYFDMYKFPWLKSTVPHPSTGNDGLIRINYKLKKSALFYTQVQAEQKERSISGTIVKEAQSHQLIKYVLNLDYNLESNITFRSRVQWVKSYFVKDEIGMLLYQDINIKLRKISFSGRYAIFDTDGFLSRQYMYEKGVLYSFNTPQFSGKGIRYYVVAKYSPFKGLAFRAKWSQTIYYDRNVIGSGSSQIGGSKKSQITFQLKYDF
jgi:helix-hairpin-helix protein